jgi:hypothetical protein
MPHPSFLSGAYVASACSSQSPFDFRKKREGKRFPPYLPPDRGLTVKSHVRPFSIIIIIIIGNLRPKPLLVFLLCPGLDFSAASPLSIYVFRFYTFITPEREREIEGSGKAIFREICP